MNKELTQGGGDYDVLLDSISNLWTDAREKAIVAVNTQLIDANWKTGQYIVEFEQGGKARAEYGKQLLSRLAKDLTIRHGKGFNRSNLTYMRKLYLAFPKCGTLSHKLTWRHHQPVVRCTLPALSSSMRGITGSIGPFVGEGVNR